jgi:diguanylate cyclase (GGDEF)-like protein/PAS domain S-box-containing protein
MTRCPASTFASDLQTIADQESLREAALHTLAILDNMLDGVITINRHGAIESFNKAASAIFGYQADEVLGRNVDLLMPSSYRDSHDGHLHHHGMTGSTSLIGKPRDMLGQRKDGSVFPLSVSVSKIARQGRPTFIGVVRDITERRQQEEEIQRLAFYDPLTQLPNRRLLLDRLKQALANSARTGQFAALMFLDLDHFKLLNDTRGHDVGDELLQQVAARLKTCVREGDTVARLGGDEFVVLLEGLAHPVHDSAAHAEGVASKILDTLGQPYPLRGYRHESTPSVGIVVFCGDQDSTDELLKKADVAMYQAKAAGRNTVRFFDPAMQASVAAHAALEHDMRRGLARQEFMLLYQFQVDVRGVPIGAEALLRWNHATRGLVPPNEFIPLAEDSGMGTLLGHWVLETACNQLALWGAQEATAGWTLSINVGSSQFADAGLVDQIDRVLRKTGANPQRLRLELTEHLLMNGGPHVRERMLAIKALGVGFSLDDFGTGYSSLHHLQRLPLDQLKIDQSFVREVLTAPDDAAVARSVVALGHCLGLTVIAEGVETAEQRNLLAELGCDAFQGYYFGRPAPASELTQLQ